MSNMVVSQVSSLAKALAITADAQELVDVLKATAFRGQVSDAQMTALLVVANQYGLNPWTKEIYAFPDKHNGIVPVVGVDGWSRIINSHPQFDGMEFVEEPEWTECIIFRKDRSRPTKIREYMVECRRPGVAPWQSHPQRMLRHKAMIQCARLAFGFVGIYDLDEAERIVDNAIAGEFSVVNDGANRPGNQAVKRTIPADSTERQDLIKSLQDVASLGADALQKEWERIGKDARKLVQDQLDDLKARAAHADSEVVGGEQA